MQVVRVSRATRRDRTSLWKDGRVYYSFDVGVNEGNKTKLISGGQWRPYRISLAYDLHNVPIKMIMSCFLHVTLTHAVAQLHGRRGRKQTIQLPQGFDDQGTILHEICHSLGMWHKQSHPDRDQYVQVYEQNIIPSKLDQFRKLTTYKVDYQGTRYDYGSVMHYYLNAFAKNSRSSSMRITNVNEYLRQGQPKLGAVQTLSSQDVVQLSRLYNCPGSGVQGQLKVNIERAENIQPSPRTVSHILSR